MLTKQNAEKLYDQAREEAKSDSKVALNTLSEILNPLNNPSEYYSSNAQILRKEIFMKISSDTIKQKSGQYGFIFPSSKPKKFDFEEKEEKLSQEKVSFEEAEKPDPRYNCKTPPMCTR